MFSSSKLQFDRFWWVKIVGIPTWIVIIIILPFLLQVQNQSHSSEGALSSLEEALNDRDKQMNQLREQRDRAEKENKEEKELHERELAEYKMKIHTYESEVWFRWGLSFILLNAYDVGWKASSPIRQIIRRKRQNRSKIRIFTVRARKNQGWTGQISRGPKY